MAAAGTTLSDDALRVLKEGWLHKKAGNGVWQRRYFYLTRTRIAYFHKQPPAGTLHNLEGTTETDSLYKFVPIEQLHDVHAPGNTGEFNIWAKQRLIRLRAATPAEAASR